MALFRSITLCGKDTFLITLQNKIETVLSYEDDTTLADINKRLEDLQTELMKLANSKAEYDKVGDEIYRLRDEKQKVQLEIIGQDELKKRIADMGGFLSAVPEPPAAANSHTAVPFPSPFPPGTHQLLSLSLEKINQIH
ncbi:DNA recombinase [Dehalobacter restrictus DSM 9455]|jgi:hypothetical protein|uniref:DNA recombinase n=1 Tax=Dehalobacter restrictus (strain DSM 9455 / PER-K23) TaxID=871738 RepID=A0ABM5P6Z9_DEHRP|nr:DNA recombinase [Dehalobacter restrictus DSM 9455]